MDTSAVTIDFDRAAGVMKPLHGVNNSPMALYAPPAGFAEAGIPFCRLHDTAGAYGGAHFVDVPNVFPDFDADPADPAAYDFAFTDAYLKQLHASGTEIFYRLGTTIENNFRIKGYHNHPPADFVKWAEICAGIVRHYNAGWADGFRFGIRYWEIWNEPENPPMWSGTREQYFELYRIASNRLKREFPELCVGGYAGCGFYAVTRPGMNDFYQSFPVWFEEFLRYVTAPATRSPLDFFSWHLYTTDPGEIAAHAEYVDTALRRFGLTHAENIFNEWNYLDPDPAVRFDLMKEAPGAAFTAAAFCVLQNSSVDKAMYYDAFPQRAYCGLYYFPSQKFTPAYYSFRAYNELYKLRFQKTAECSAPGVYVCAAADGSDGAALLVNVNPTRRTLRLTVSGAPAFRCARITDRRRTFAEIPVPDGELVLPAHSVLLLLSRPPEAGRAKLEPCSTRKIHAGIDDGGQQ